MNRQRTKRGFEDFLGFAVQRRQIHLGSDEPHDETFSYGLCQRFWGRDEELKDAIAIGNLLLQGLLRKAAPREELSLWYSLIGNMYYLKGDFSMSTGYFMKSITYNRNDMTPWIELLFALRALGEFELFEAGIFNIERLYRDMPEGDVTQATFCSFIEQLKDNQGHHVLEGANSCRR